MFKRLISLSSPQKDLQVPTPTHLDGALRFPVGDVGHVLGAAVDEEVPRAFHQSKNFLEGHKHQRCLMASETQIEHHLGLPELFEAILGPTFTSGWLYMVTLSGTTLTSSTNKSSTAAEAGELETS